LDLNWPNCERNGVTSIAFDVYGTLVDPLLMNPSVASILGEKTTQFVALWRQKQVEYAFRRGLMQNYVDFNICSDQALELCFRTFALRVTPVEKEVLLAAHLQLPPYPDVIAGLEQVEQLGHEIYAFSNGPRSSVQQVLRSGQLDHFFRDIISVDEIGTFKPNPAVYAHLCERLRRTANEVWLVSSNVWDVIGAKSAGLRAAWIRRSPEQIFDPWEYEPDLIVSDLKSLSKRIPAPIVCCRSKP
jgi:2-haloacid dehalogenase